MYSPERSKPISHLPLKIEQFPLGDVRLKHFTRFPWKLYDKHPYWTPPLSGELLGNRLFGLVGLHTGKHPYHRHTEVTHFLARKNGDITGRISATVNHRFNEYYDSKTGFFGHFEVVDDFETAETLLDSARKWLAERGMTSMRGPGEYSNATHERQGILIDGFEYPPTVDLTHNHRYYAELLHRYGFRKIKDYYAYIMDLTGPAPEILKPLVKKALSRRRIETRELVMKNLREEVRLIVKIYNDSWNENWGFLPITDEEADMLADSLQLVVDPHLVRFAFVDGEPAAVLGAFPDPYYELSPRWKWYGDSDLVRLGRLLLRKKKIPMTRLMFFGVRPDFRKMGIDAVLFDEVRDYAVRYGYQKCEASLLLEDNEPILSASKFMGARRYKTWRIYELPLE
jgi:GNAT superfamily N-acetyltransferase